MTDAERWTTVEGALALIGLLVGFIMGVELL